MLIIDRQEILPTRLLIKLTSQSNDISEYDIAQCMAALYIGNPSPSSVGFGLYDEIVKLTAHGDWTDAAPLCVVCMELADIFTGVLDRLLKGRNNLLENIAQDHYTMTLLLKADIKTL